MSDDRTAGPEAANLVHRAGSAVDLAISAATMLIEPRVRPVGTGQVRRLLPYRQRRMIGPFIFVDVMGPERLVAGTGTDVDAHPHIGLAAVTYLLEGRLVHRDSTGAVAAIEPGAVNWMTAGAGATHTERSHSDDRTTDRLLHGLRCLPDRPTHGWNPMKRACARPRADQSSPKHPLDLSLLLCR